AGLVSLYAAKAQDGSFGYKFPEACDDGHVTVGTDYRMLKGALSAQIPDLPMPPVDHVKPSTPVVLEFAEFIVRNVGKPLSLGYHDYHKHNHLKFDRDTGFSETLAEINELLSRNGMAYRLDDSGLAR